MYVALYILMYNVLETPRNHTCSWMNNKKYYRNLISCMSHFLYFINLAFKHVDYFKWHAAIT